MPLIGAIGKLGQQAPARLLLLIPAFVLLVPFFFVPLAIMLQYGFFRFLRPGQFQPALVLDNYWRFISDNTYRNVMVVTLEMSVIITVVSLILGYPFAYMLARRQGRLGQLLLVVVLVPLMASLVARTYGWIAMLSGSGVINSLLQAVGLPQQRLMFNMLGIVIALTEVLLPFMILSIVASLQHLDRTLEQAAASLGAPPRRTFMDVVLPLSMPGVAAGCVLVFVQAMSAFATPSLIGGATTQVMATTVYTQAVTVLNWPFASALSFTLLFITLVLTVAQNRILAVRHVR